MGNFNNAVGTEAPQQRGRKYFTRGKVSLDESNLPYTVTTSQVQNYLREKSRVVAQTCGIDPIDDELNIYTIHPGKNFYPFIVTLPLSALENNDVEEYEDDEEIFIEKKDNEIPLKIKKEYFNMLKPYIYDSREAGAFMTETYRNIVGIEKATTGRMLEKYATPRIKNSDGVKVVLFLLNPINVFHDMLMSEDPSDKRKFTCHPTFVKRTKDLDYRYTVSKVLKKNESKKKGNSWIEDLDRSIQNGKIK